MADNSEWGIYRELCKKMKLRLHLPAPIFSSIRLGKYSKWAVDLTNDQLVALLWLVGEHCVRSHVDMVADHGANRIDWQLLEHGANRIDWQLLELRGGGPFRKARAYNLLLEFYRNPFGLDEAIRKMKEKR